ncbi:hypothetical protein QFC21_002090 [Naganishia friedmannii]|uniref:Uncharacterized protein n=1 Tax=Naganishia friedmannii TaxID=89922 RepID=A0ACC2W0G0_9TREE|nr:hypothetical protein QFC21_002090 [Naganishia friedmannii]
MSAGLQTSPDPYYDFSQLPNLDTTPATLADLRQKSPYCVYSDNANMTALHNTGLSAHHQLLSDLSAIQQQTFSHSGSPGNADAASLSTGSLHAGEDVSSEFNVDNVAERTRGQARAILLDSASSQGNSGILSIVPPIFGPDSLMVASNRNTSDVDTAIWNRMPEEISLKSVSDPSRYAPAMPTRPHLGPAPSKKLDQSQNAFEAEPFPGWGMIARMRTWRHGAIMQHLHQTAVFWGDKIFSWTGEPTDAFWLAQAHFLMADYGRAEAILMSPLRATSLFCRTPDESPLVGEYDDTATSRTSYATTTTPSLANTLAQKQDKNAWMKPSYSSAEAGVWGTMMDTSPGSHEQHVNSSTSVDDHDFRPRGSMVDWSMPCRYLATLSLLHQERLVDALSLVGESNPFAATGRNHRNVRSETGDLKLEASMCRLRGVLYLRLNSLQLAKESYMESLALDIRNYDVFLELTNSMMTPEEEWHFIHSLSFSEQLHPDDARFVRLIYTARLHSNPNLREISIAKASLARRFQLEGNPDIQATNAQRFFVESQWEKCYDLTSNILQEIPNHREALPLHLACLTQLPRLASSLFMLAHRLVKDEPLSAVSCATHEQDARFSPAWICFAHCFAYEGEHEQAITAYSTTARIFPGTHLPYMCIGMEYMQMNNLTMAQDALHTAYTLCDTDPTLLNEMGVLRYYEQEYDVAAQLFSKALQLASCLPASQTIWADIYCNLAHCERRKRNTAAAEALYMRAVKYNALSSSPYTGLGMIAEVAGDLEQSIERYHQALALAPQDAVTTVLLESVLSRQEALAKSRSTSSSVAKSASLLS